MSKFSMIRITYYLLWAISLADSGIALPTYERTTLPFPRAMAETEKEMAKEITNLHVYPDSSDPNQYYYVPPFHIRQYNRGAASPFLHALQLEHYGNAKRLIIERENYAKEYSLERLEMLEKEVLLRQKDVKEMEKNLHEAIERGNERIIALWEKMLSKHVEIYEASLAELIEGQNIIKNGGTLWPEPARIRYDLQIVGLLIRGGASILPEDANDPQQLAKKINEAMSTVENNYGGFLSVNAYAGFSKAQLEALRGYKEKYMPRIKISLMPFDQLTFFGLTEHKKSSNGSKMFREFNGSGDYLGAAIVMDISIGGAVGFAQHLTPFVLPVGVKATLSQQALPTEAHLSCDFSNGYFLEGRSDVRDGMVIFDNDISNDFHARDNNHGKCRLNIISGDLNSAKIMAIQELERQFESKFIYKTSLSQQEKEAYYRGVLNDVQNNRRNSSSPDRFESIAGAYSLLGWQGAVVQAVSSGADFHWHTNIQNISNLSNFKFDKRISIKGHTNIKKDFPTNLCLVFNKETQAYDRCTEEEIEHALSMQNATEEAANSPECKGAQTPFECGKKRDEAGRTTRYGTPIVGNETVVNQI